MSEPANGREYAMNSWGFGVTPLLDSSPLPPIFGEMGKLPNFAKTLTVHLFGELS